MVFRNALAIRLVLAIVFPRDAVTTPDEVKPPAMATAGEAHNKPGGSSHSHSITVIVV